MKKIFYIITLATFAFACNKLEKNEFLINGSAKGVKDGTSIYLNLQGENGFLVKDSAVIKNEKFNLKGTIETPEIGFIRMAANNGDFPFILEHGKINIEVNKDTIQISKLSGTLNNEKLQSYNNESKVVFNKIIKYNVENQMTWIKAKKENDSATMNKLNAGLKSFQQELNDVSVKFVKNNPEAFLSVLLIENFITRQHLPVEEIKVLFSKINKEYSNSKSALNIKKILNEYSSLESNSDVIKAQEFSAKNPDGKEISLKESLGKVTIIDFWASWCGPCRAENPNVVALYNQYHEKGLNIIGVSLDKDAAKWKEAIAKDGLTWSQVSNLKFWDEPIAKLYNVKAIPAMFILDANGNIVAKDLKGEALKAKVEELLAK